MHELHERIRGGKVRTLLQLIDDIKQFLDQCSKTDLVASGVLIALMVGASFHAVYFILGYSYG